MSAKLVDESKSEEIYKAYLKSKAEDGELMYRCRYTYGYYKQHFVDFRELIFKRNLIVIKDEGYQLIVENLSKTNNKNSSLIVRHFLGNESFLKDAVGVLSKMFSGRKISKLKVVCFDKELSQLKNVVERCGFVEEVNYRIGENNRIHYAFLL